MNTGIFFGDTLPLVHLLDALEDSLNSMLKTSCYVILKFSLDN